VRTRWLAGVLCGLCVASAQVAGVGGVADTQVSDGPLGDIECAAGAFTRSAPLPAWADLAAPPPIPPQASRRSVVVQLWETLLLVAPSPIRLTHRIVRVKDAIALAEIGQVTLDFNPQFERLLLHKLLIVRGTETIDHTSTAPVRFLQREPRLGEGVYSGVVTALIVLPGVRAGDTLHLVYSVAGENPALGARYARVVPWDQPYPLVLRSVTMVAPVQRQVGWRWIGGAGGASPMPVETVQDGLRRLRFEARNLVAATTEPMMPAHVSPTRQLQLSEFANWNEVARWAAALFPAPAPLPEQMAALVDRLRALPDRQEQVSQALQWVQKEIRQWSAATGECALRPQSPAVVVQRGYGDCKDKTLLLVSILHALDIDARPTLVAANNHNDPASMLPAPEAFDHVIAQVRMGGRDFYLDPTRHGQIGLLSRMGQRFEGAAVLPIDATTHGLVVVRSPNREDIFRSHVRERLSLATLDAEGRLDVEIRWFGIHAETVRATLDGMDAAEFRHFASASYLRQYPGARLIGEPQFHDERRLNQFTVTASFSVPGLARQADGVWAVAFAPSLGDAIVLPPRRVRRFPLLVPSFPITYHYDVEMTWPDGVSAVGAPSAGRLDTPYFRMLTTRDVRGNWESRSIEFAAKVSEVPPFEVQSLANDLNRMARQIGGVMLAERTRTPPVAPLPPSSGGL
jgi:transglutaminase-like putative cysteine protease